MHFITFELLKKYVPRTNMYRRILFKRLKTLTYDFKHNIVKKRDVKDYWDIKINFTSNHIQKIEDLVFVGSIKEFKIWIESRPEYGQKIEFNEIQGEIKLF
jgi:ribosomal protein L20